MPVAVAALLPRARPIFYEETIMSYIKLAAPWALATCPWVQTAQANEAAEDATIIVTAPQFADEAENEASRTAGGTDIVRHEDYADKSIVSLRDVLAFSPGVYLQPRYGQEVRISIRGSGLSRGFHMRGLTLLQDGVPINLADDNGDFQELEPIFFDHLQVYRGSNALRFGSGTLGGAINGVTPTGRTARGIYVRADAGSFDSFRGLISGGVASDRVDVWAGISADSSDGDRDHVRRRSLRFHGNVGMTFSDVVSSRVYVSFNNIDQEIPGALTQVQALTNPRMANPASVNGDNARDIDSLRIQSRTRFDWGALKLDVGGFVNTKSLYHPIFQVIDQESADVGGFFRAGFTADVVEVTVGGELRRGNTRARQFVNLAGRRGALTFDADQQAQTASLYGELRVRPTRALSLIVGGVYAEGYRKRTVNVSTGRSGQIDLDAFSPKFGVLFEPSSIMQFFANYSRSAEFPGFGEVFQNIGTPPISQLVTAIRPQRAWTAEIGTRGQAGIVNWDLALYRSTLRGELLQFNVNPLIPAATFNADRTLHQGIEAALELKPADWLRLRQIYTYSDFRFRGDAQYGNNRLPVVPKHSYRAELRVGSDTLFLSPNVEWVPTGPFSDYRNLVRTPGYALVGLTGGARLTRGVDIFVDVRNIMGKKAIGDVGAVITALPTSAIYYPVERRAISAGVRARF
jgi:iron complex outermembrane recepter protein